MKLVTEKFRAMRRDVVGPFRDYYVIWYNRGNHRPYFFTAWPVAAHFRKR